METICRIAFSIQILWSAFYLILYVNGDPISLIAWLVYIALILFLIGLTFANLQSVALEPMGAIAGTASTVIGSLMTAISLSVGIVFSQFMGNSANPLILTFFMTGLIALLLIRLKAKPSHP